MLPHIELPFDSSFITFFVTGNSRNLASRQPVPVAALDSKNADSKLRACVSEKRGRQQQRRANADAGTQIFFCYVIVVNDVA